jgi:hypothetical protein
MHLPTRANAQSRRIALFSVVLFLSITLAVAAWVATARAAGDDWEAVADGTGETAPRHGSVRGANPPLIPQGGSAGDAAGRPLRICGEAATPASPQVAAMVSRINQVWGSDFHAYQTVAFEQPHASTGGCVFYNTSVMAAIMNNRLDVTDTKVVNPLIWAIFAHEIGHQYHHDTQTEREGVPSEIKELEADRFAGYTLEKLKIRATDLSPYWNLTGDEFSAGVSAHNRHGSSAQRVAAFKQGWNLAEWDRPENSQSVTEAGSESVAPDSSDGAPM